mgnify:CR=1 FL=1
MKRLGFGWEECKVLNPRLIYASISGFGQTGPNSYKPGYDLIAQAMGGEVRCEASPLGSARFCFSWPVYHQLPDFTSA